MLYHLDISEKDGGNFADLMKSGLWKMVDEALVVVEAVGHRLLSGHGCNAFFAHPSRLCTETAASCGRGGVLSPEQSRLQCLLGTPTSLYRDRCFLRSRRCPES